VRTGKIIRRNLMTRTVTRAGETKPCNLNIGRRNKRDNNAVEWAKSIKYRDQKKKRRKTGQSVNVHGQVETLRVELSC